MGLNPFKDSDLNDLQQNIFEFLSHRFEGVVAKIKDWWARFVKKGNERITLMLIPHSEKRIVNFHISIFAISIIIGIVSISVTITSVLIINHSSTIKEVSKLKKYGKYSKISRQTYKEEIEVLHTVFQDFRREIEMLHKLRLGSKYTSLWARGGGTNNTKGTGDQSVPPDELLKFKEIQKDLIVAKENMEKIKKFLSYRKRIIENTPSMWPVSGHIVSRFGYRNSPHTFQREHHYGLDIEAYPASEIKATAPGKVSQVRWDDIRGLTISIKHKYGFVTVYSHCQRAVVKVGQKIAKGDVIGYVGRTGKTTKYICYYQIKIGTTFVDPMPYLNKISW